jgi:hypothetical protein
MLPSYEGGNLCFQLVTFGRIYSALRSKGFCQLELHLLQVGDHLGHAS